MVNAWDRLYVGDKCSHMPQLSQAVPAAMSQVDRRHTRTRLKDVDFLHHLNRYSSVSFSPLSSSLATSWFVSLAMTLKDALRHIYDVCRDKGKTVKMWTLGPALSKSNYRRLQEILLGVS